MSTARTKLGRSGRIMSISARCDPRHWDRPQYQAEDDIEAGQ